jgi:hypothetical protein
VAICCGLDAHERRTESVVERGPCDGRPAVLRVLGCVKSLRDAA